MHAHLVTGGTQDTRDTFIHGKIKSWNIHSSDVHILIPNPSIGIDSVRGAIQSIALKPYASDTSVLFIKNASEMTIEAQNALLKTLEEPPQHARIILETFSTDHILSTILSRCTVTWIQAAKPESIQNDIYEMYMNIKSTGQWLRYVDQLIKQGHTPEAILASLFLSINTRTGSQKDALLYRACLKAKTYLDSHINPKSVLDSLRLTASGQGW